MKNSMIAASVVASVFCIAGCTGLKNGANPYAALVKGAPAGANTLTDAEKAEGWRLAWDGKTFDGWVAAKKDFKATPDRGWEIKDGTLTMEIFIDRSLVEGYFNADKAISIRSYADPGSRGISLFGGEMDVISLTVRPVSSIYE